MKKFKVSGHAFDSPTCLAPMAGIGNVAFRILCRKYGAGLVYSEFVNATAISRENAYALQMMETASEERPVAIQLFGTKIPDIKKATKLLQDKCDHVDFNFGCPAHQITCTGAGAALMKHPMKVKKIVEAMVSMSSKPVTVKMRLGIDERNINIVDVAKKCEEAGAAAVAVHGRTLKQKYMGNADWELIKSVKDVVEIPVIGNGDVVDEESAVAMFEQTGVDAVMLGRAACGNPFIFSRINHYLKTGKKLEQKNTLAIFDEYLTLWKKHEGLRFSNLKMQVSYFTTGLVGGKHLRKKLVGTRSLDELEEVLDGFREEGGK
jgi:tRNA-dihydrouridine synthase B